MAGSEGLACQVMGGSSGWLVDRDCAFAALLRVGCHYTKGKFTMSKFFHRWLLAAALFWAALSSPSANAAAWYDGAIQYSSILNCVSVIQGTPYYENGMGVYTGFYASPSTYQPAVNTVYYAHVVLYSLGNACSGQRANIEVQLPPNTSLAIDGAHPVYCFYDGSPLGLNECTQSFPASGYHAGAYWIPSADSANAYTWPMPQGHNLEIQIPLTSSAVLANATFQANILALDGNSNPWLYPQIGVYVFAPQLTATTTTITGSNPNPSVTGQAVAVNYSVTTSSGALTGNVTVSDGAGGTCTGTAAAGSCQITFTTAGTKTLTASYAGDASHASSTSAGYSQTVNSAMTKKNDLNGDGKSDILWHNVSGTTSAWLMNGTSILSTSVLLTDPNWTVVGTGDFNGDGKWDILWRNASTGQVTVWIMNGTSVSSWGSLLTNPAWTVVGTGDFNGDGKWDILWRNASTGQVTVWMMNGTTVSSWGSLLTDPAWTVVGTGDFNGDGKWDILWRNASTGQVTVWMMNGTSVSSWGALLTDPAWTVAGTGDLNGDGKWDILWRNASTGQVTVWMMNGTSVSSWGALLTDPNWTVAGTGDLNGDGKYDILWRNTPTGQVTAWLMNGTSVTGWATLLGPGNTAWDVVSK